MKLLVLGGTVFLHDALMYVSLVVLVGHLYLALIHPTTRHSLRGMTTGNVLAAILVGSAFQLFLIPALLLVMADSWLADRVYSGVPAEEFGKEQQIEIGPMSGKSNVLFWLEKHGISADDSVVNRIFDAAKQSARVLTDSEVFALCSETARH